MAPTAVVLLHDKTKKQIPGCKAVEWGGEGRQVGDIKILKVCHEAPSKR